MANAQNLRADESYFFHSRDNLLAYLPRPVGKVLDVGCGGGANASSLRELGATRLVGVELVERYARAAEKAFDEVHVGAIEDVLDRLDSDFESVLCLDVLE